MKSKRITILGILIMSCMMFSGCSGPKSEIPSDQTVAEPAKEKEKLPDGIYTADFDTDNSMFHVSEACDGKGTLRVENGEMTIHISLGSKNIINLYPGLAEDAKKEGAQLLYPTVDTVTYSDGFTEEVYGFDVPVPALDEEFDLALIGTKGKWYDHKVIVSGPEPANEDGAKDIKLDDGIYTVELTFDGGSGKANILSPATVSVSGGNVIATIMWSSPNYDYMLVDGEKYLPVNEEGNSVFEIPVKVFDEPVTVTGDTVAMSTPHEIDYTITFHSDTVKQKELIYESSMELEYAENFAVDHYEGGYAMLTTTMDGQRFLIVPEQKECPEGIENGIVVLKRPIKNIYLVASAVMDMFSELDGLDAIAFSGQKEENWYIEAAQEAMAQGKIAYAGKYSKPDYELLFSGGCALAIENRMISHSPQVVEKLNDFGIPVMIEYSSYESLPLGRVEWIKFFGALLGEEEKADRIFEAQSEILKRITAEDKTDKSVAFFFITSNGLVQIRQPSDYIPKMIELAGGKYVFDDIKNSDTKRSTVNIQAEKTRIF